MSRKPNTADEGSEAPGEHRSGDADAFRWSVLRADQLTPSLIAEWETLARSRTPLAGGFWCAAFARAFAGAGGRLQAHCLRAGGRLVCVLPLMRSGVIGARSALRNEHWPYWSFAHASDVPLLGAEILRHVLANAPALEVGPIHRESEAAELLLAAARDSGLRVHVAPVASGDAQMDLEGGFESIAPRLHKHLLRDAQQGRRRLAAAGRLEYERCLDETSVLAALDECLAVEALGWKAACGSPIRSRSDTNAFYREVAREGARAGRMALYVLRLDGRILAFEYCLRGGRQIELLKISYDPSMSRMSPGTVLRAFVLEQEAGEGAITTYHLGRPSEWKLRWTETVAPLSMISVFGNGWSGRIAELGSLLDRKRSRTAARWIRRTLRVWMGGGLGG